MLANNYYLDRLNKTVSNLEGITGFNVFPSANRDSTNADVARVALKMCDEYLAGNFEDITDRPL